MKRYLFLFVVILLMLAPAGVQAKKNEPPPPPPGPTAQEQQDFTQRYWKAVEDGTIGDFKSDISNHGTANESAMLSNMVNGKAADGGEAKGFHGDPTDNGPSNLSNWIPKTDKDGNVIGFDEKDAEAKDTNKDGKISDEERDAYDKKKAEQDAQNGGPPGNNWKNPDWDKNGDGIPDPDFTLDCYRCQQPPPQGQCMDGKNGACPGTCYDQQCFDHTENVGGKTISCHSCGPKETIASFCASHGFWDDAACSNECPDGWECVQGDIDKKSGQRVPANQTREKGSTEPCYLCHIRIEVAYVILIVETPYERFVLDKSKPGDSFKPSSVMALAKADPKTGSIANAAGKMKSAKDFLSSMGAGFGPGGIMSPGKISMNQLSSALGSSLSKGGSFGANCFDDAVKTADADAAAQGLPTSQEIQDPNKGKKDKDKENTGAVSKEDIKKAENAGVPAVSGPIVACGQEGKNKVLRIYDAGGSVVDTITQAMLKANPDIITEKLGFAQQFADQLIAKTGFDFASYVEKFTGLPLRDMQQVAAQVQHAKSTLDAALNQGKKKKNTPAPEVILPNDPLYKLSEEQKKKIERKKTNTPNIIIGTTLKMGGKALGGGNRADLDEKKEPKAADQYALQIIGYTPYTDPNSAWNVVDASQKNVVIALVDSGLDMSHPDAPQYIWTNPKEIPGNNIDDDKDGFVDDIHGWNFVNENHDFTDVRGHGTFVAGIIAAKTNNNIGIAGINPGAVIMPIKVADDEGQTDSFAIYRGINFAVNHGAKIINVSLGGRIISKLEQQAIERAHAMGAIVVVAAGNSNENLMLFGPSSTRNALSVGEIDHDGVRSTASNWGPNLGLVAPGEDIYSLCSKDNKHVLPSVRQNGYYQLDGTSFSTPMVTATASLIWAKNPQLTNTQVVDLILATAKDMDDTGWDGMTGAGVLNAAAALRAEVQDQVVVMFTNMHFNKDVRGKAVSVDLSGSVRGPVKEFTIEASKGKRLGKFVQIAGPFTGEYNYQHIARINVQEFLRGSDDWNLRIRAVDAKGREHIATTPLTIPQ